MLSKRFRLTKRGSFSYVYRKGTLGQTGIIRMLYVKSSTLKIGFSVSNKIGKATVRNKIKRQMRAAVRGQIKRIRAGYQIVFVARPEVKDFSFVRICGDMEYLLKRAGMVEN